MAANTESITGAHFFSKSVLKRTIVYFVEACILAVVLAGCTSAQDASSSVASSAATSVEATASSAATPASNAESTTLPKKLAIIHTNDTHGYDQADDGVLGMGAVAQLKADYLAQGYDVLLLDAGDTFEGNLLADDSQGETIPAFMNACGYDAMALGNHEFDYGADVLEKLIAKCDFPVLCANITVDATGELFAQANSTFTLSDGTKVGVFALDTPETQTKSAPRNTEGLSFASGEDLYACAQAQIDQLRADGCDLVVCLGHLGELESSEPNRASDVIGKTSGIDLFIDAHDHVEKSDTVIDAAGNSVTVLETGCYLANIGVVLYEDGELSHHMVGAGNYEGSNAELSEQIDKAAADIDARMGKLVATSAVDLEGEKEIIRTSETNLGDLVTDALLWQARQALGPQVDAAIINSGALRTSIPAGDIALMDIHNVSPYVNQVYAIEITGAQLLEALESACQAAPEPLGAFPQVAGITFTLDVSVPYEDGEQYPYSTYHAPAKPGSRVTITDVGGKGFDLDATYKLATINFIATGGDTYAVFAGLANSLESTGYLFYQAVQHYLEDECAGVVPETYAQPQGRITVVGAAEAALN